MQKERESDVLGDKGGIKKGGGEEVEVRRRARLLSLDSSTN